MQKLRRRMEKFKGLSVGLDLHKEFIQVSVLDEEGDEVRAERIDSGSHELRKLLRELEGSGRPLRAALEASGCFLWVYDLLVAELGRSSVQVAAPSKVRVIAEGGDKTDANDAWWLAYLSHEGRLPRAFVAEGDLRDLRIASRELRRVTDERGDLKRRLRSHFAQLGMTFAHSAWDSEKGRRGIDTLVRAAAREHGLRGEAIARLWDRVRAMGEEVEHWRGRVEHLSAKFDEVALMERELPGVGVQLAAVVWSELGDPRRYRRAKAYAKATGLTPDVHESGGRRRHKKKITRAGSAHVRWALTRAVLACTRCKYGPGTAVKAWLERAYRRKSKKAAIVAAARKLAEAIWRLFALGEAFDLRRVFPA